jgi:hypothetical protein
MMNMAIDGVALKHAVDAWATAPPFEKATRFAAAETVRWLEWGAHAFFEILLGLTITAFGLALARRTRTRWQGVLAVPAGVLVTVDGTLVGQHGFAGSPLLLIGLFLFVGVTTSLVVRGRGEQRAIDPTDRTRRNLARPVAAGRWSSTNRRIDDKPSPAGTHTSPLGS